MQLSLLAFIGFNIIQNYFHWHYPDWFQGIPKHWSAHGVTNCGRMCSTNGISSAGRWSWISSVAEMSWHFLKPQCTLETKATWFLYLLEVLLLFNCISLYFFLRFNRKLSRHNSISLTVQFRSIRLANLAMITNILYALSHSPLQKKVS